MALLSASSDLETVEKLRSVINVLKLHFIPRGMKHLKYDIFFEDFNQPSLWRNRLARSTVNRKVGGSSPPRDAPF